jgi:hypothetical protein
LPENPASYRGVRTKSYLFNKAPVWLTKHLRISPENNDKSLIRIEMETFDKVCGDKRGLLAVTQKQNGMFMRCDDSPGFFMVQRRLQSQLIR